MPLYRRTQKCEPRRRAGRRIANLSAKPGSLERMVRRHAPECNWTNVPTEVGNPGEPRWVRHGCFKRQSKLWMLAVPLCRRTTKLSDRRWAKPQERKKPKYEPKPSRGGHSDGSLERLVRPAMLIIGGTVRRGARRPPGGTPSSFLEQLDTLNFYRRKIRSKSAFTRTFEGAVLREKSKWRQSHRGRRSSYL